MSEQPRLFVTGPHLVITCGDGSTALRKEQYRHVALAQDAGRVVKFSTKCRQGL